jgi:Flp pilus assembly protein TadD
VTDSDEELQPRRRWTWIVALIALLAVGHPVARRLTRPAPAAASASIGDPAAASARALGESLEHYRAGRYAEAVTAAEAAIAADPGNAAAFNNLAVARLALGQFDPAVDAALEAIRLQPELQLARNNLAWIQRVRAEASQ